MKNIINIRQKNKKKGNNNIIKDNIINTSYMNKKSCFNNILRQGDIYVHKKNSASGIDNKYSHLNNKYNVTINNIHNCNYISLF